MIYLVKGSPDSGKSQFAETLICEHSDKQRRYYCATMIPYGEEGKKRIEKHRRLRADRDFITIEKSFSIDEIVNEIECPEESYVLLECVSNLLANEMFECRRKPDELEDIVVNQIIRLAKRIKELVIVTNDFTFDDKYDEDTKLYISLCNDINVRLEKMSDEVFEIERKTENENIKSPCN